VDSPPEIYTPPPPPRPLGPTLATRAEPPKWMQLGAVVLGVGPLYGLVFYSGLQSLDAGEMKITAAGLLFNLALMGMFALFLVGMLLILGERLPDLQLKPGSFAKDLGSGVGLFFGILGALFLMRVGSLLLERLGLAPPIDPVPDANLDLIGSVTKDPLLFALFIGPVIWFQAAVVEELTRAFVLTRLWKVWPGAQARLASVIVWSLLFGLAHIYQGATGVIGTALIGLVLGLSYLRRGRLLPLIIAHGLYDTLATLALLYALQHPELLKPTL
jgi:membrane protease YdiL (CAAX protease family)